MRLLSKFIRPLILASLAASLIVTGCGDTKRNDQGVSLSFTGWFFERQIDDYRAVTSCRAPLGDTGNPSGTTSCESSFGTFTPGIDEGIGQSGDLTLLAGLTNHMTGQGVRLDRIHHDYTVPGQDIAVPSTTIPVGFFLGPAPDPTGDGGAENFNNDSTLPDNFDLGDGDRNETPLSEIRYLPAQLITNDVREFLIFHRTKLPEPPYQMILRSYFSGLTTSGNRIRTNDIDFTVIWTPDVIVIPQGTDLAPSSLEGEDDGLDELEEGLVIEDE